MINKKYPFNDNGNFNEIGTPFEVFENDNPPYHSNARIIPSQFNFPTMYMNYTVIRDITDDDDRNLKE